MKKPPDPVKARERRERVHRRIDREHEETFAKFKRTGQSERLANYPALRALLESARAAALAGHRFPNRKFSYEGRCYRVRFTSFDRVILIHPKTGNEIGDTVPFSSSGW